MKPPMWYVGRSHTALMCVLLKHNTQKITSYPLIPSSLVSSQVVPTVYYVSDLLSLVVLLIMLSKSVGKFAFKANESSKKFQANESSKKFQSSFKNTMSTNTMQTTGTSDSQLRAVEMGKLGSDGDSGTGSHSGDEGVPFPSPFRDDMNDRVCV